MKNFVMAAAIAAFLPAQLAAQTQTAPEVSQDQILADVNSSSSGIWLPVFLLAVVAVAAIAGSSSGSYMGGMGNMGNASDERLKTDIVPTGVTADGHQLYQFRYIGLPTVYEGVMAQDVIEYRPDAVSRHSSGYLMVDYGKLGLEMRVID